MEQRTGRTSAPTISYSLFPVRSLKDSRGVTLVELLVVAVLASILLALVFPSIRAGMGTLELRSSAQHLAAAAKFARDQAIFRQRPFELEVNGAAGAITVFDSEGGSRRFELPGGVRVGSIRPAEAGPESRTRSFLFLPDGRSVAFEVVLENGRRRIKVAADPLTGFPKISDVSAVSDL